MPIRIPRFKKLNESSPLPKTPLEIYAVKIVGATNPYWPIGAYLRYKPEQYEDVYGPGGRATYEPEEKLSHATFTDRDGAVGIIRFMERHPGVEFALVKFVEAS